jgi:hypothetical protein
MHTAPETEADVLSSFGGRRGLETEAAAVGAPLVFPAVRDGKAVLVVATTDTRQLVSIEIDRDGTLSLFLDARNASDSTDEWPFSRLQVAEAKARARQYWGDNPDEIRRLLDRAYGRAD